MADMSEAGRKADAHRVRDLYRSGFGSEPKTAARRRAITALKAAGVTTCLDLWGGGLSANDLVASGMSVVSVDDGRLDLSDHGWNVSNARKRRALEYAAAEGGYVGRWGKVSKFAHEADGAFLDFCGPWANDVRLAIEACRHMKAVVVTLMSDHELVSDATTRMERRLAYEAFLRHAFAPSHSRPTYLRRLASYKRDGGQPVFLYLLSPDRPTIPRLTSRQRMQLDPEFRRREYISHQAWAKRKNYWRNLPPEVKKARQAYVREYIRTRMATDPAYAEHNRKLAREYSARQRAADPVKARHANHKTKKYIVASCPLCVPATEVGAPLATGGADQRGEGFTG